MYSVHRLRHLLVSPALLGDLYCFIKRDRAYKILNEAAQEIGLGEIGTHSMRKTFGYWHYQKYKDVALLQHLFNHANSAVTLRYIGVNQDIMDQSVSDFFL